MNWNVRYAHEGNHPWPSEDNLFMAIRHLATHHQSSFKSQVQQMKDMFSSNNVPEHLHQELINRSLPDTILDSVKNGGHDISSLLTVHDIIHDRMNRPDRGVDVIFPNYSDAIRKIMSDAQKNHQHE
jgi:hypothetical protein